MISLFIILFLRIVNSYCIAYMEQFFNFVRKNAMKMRRMQIIANYVDLHHCILLIRCFNLLIVFLDIDMFNYLYLMLFFRLTLPLSCTTYVFHLEYFLFLQVVSFYSQNTLYKWNIQYLIALIFFIACGHNYDDSQWISKQRQTKWIETYPSHMTNATFLPC